MPQSILLFLWEISLIDNKSAIERVEPAVR